jgi:hypothetical protein
VWPSRGHVRRGGEFTAGGIEHDGADTGVGVGAVPNGQVEGAPHRHHIGGMPTGSRLIGA